MSGGKRNFCSGNYTGKKLNGKSVLAEIIRQFGIETIKIEIEDEMRNTILEAQKRQTMVNA